jgi:hypothetical protein
MILLVTDDCAVFPPSGEADAHGWAFGPASPEDVPTPPTWAGGGNLQLAFGTAAVVAADTGGHGPFAPNSVMQGTVYLPLDCPARDGWLLVARARVYSLTFQHQVPDPSGGPIGARVGNVTELVGEVAPDVVA